MIRSQDFKVVVLACRGSGIRGIGVEGVKSSTRGDKNVAGYAVGGPGLNAGSQVEEGTIGETVSYDCSSFEG